MPSNRFRRVALSLPGVIEGSHQGHADFRARKRIFATLGYQTLAPTAAKADQMVDDRLATPVTADANDFLYQWQASHDYNPSPALERIEATLLAINAADDERNPPETGITDAALKRVKNGRLYLIPASAETRGHLTTGNAKFYTQQLQDLLQTAPQRTM